MIDVAHKLHHVLHFLTTLWIIIIYDTVLDVSIVPLKGGNVLVYQLPLAIFFVLVNIIHAIIVMCLSFTTVPRQ